MKKQLPGWAVLLIITLVAGLALGGTYTLTKDTIENQARMTAENARKAVLPLADTFEEIPVSTRVAAVKGFAGPVSIRLTTDESGAIASLTVGGPQFAETPGFGAKALEEAFTQQFIGKTTPVEMADIDAIAGATITTNAVLDAVNKAADYQSAVDWCYAGLKDGQIVGYVAQVTTKGFGGPVEVIVGVDTTMTLTGVSVGGSSFAETAGLGAKSKDAAFTSQFIGKQVPTTVIKAGGTPGDNTVDAITSATITSNAVSGAVNKAADHVKMFVAPDQVTADIVLPERPATGAVSASKQGFAGPVWVEAAFDASGRITYLTIGDSAFSETPGFGEGALEPAFMAQFIGKTAPLTLTDIDAISGATITSTAVVEAINAAYATLSGEAPEATEMPAPTGEPTLAPTTAPTAAPAANNAVTAEAQGFAGPVFVSVVFEGDKILSVKIGDQRFAETPGFGAGALEEAFAAQFAGKTAPLTLTDIDAVSGATVTSIAVVEAINAAYTQSTSGN